MKVSSSSRKSLRRVDAIAPVERSSIVYGYHSAARDSLTAHAILTIQIQVSEEQSAALRINVTLGTLLLSSCITTLQSISREAQSCVPDSITVPS
jgi:hypothetical protein